MDRDEVRTWSMETHEVPEWALREFSQVLAPWERCRADQYLSPWTAETTSAHMYYAGCCCPTVFIDPCATVTCPSLSTAS